MLAQALGKSELADVRFKVRGVWVASGHRSWLSGRSPVFARMFANETEEKATGIVNMDDVTAEGLGMFLQFMYLGESPLSTPICFNCNARQCSQYSAENVLKRKEPLDP